MHPFQDASVELMERPLSSPKKLPLPSSGATRSRCQAQGLSARAQHSRPVGSYFYLPLFLYQIIYKLFYCRRSPCYSILYNAEVEVRSSVADQENNCRERRFSTTVSSLVFPPSTVYLPRSDFVNLIISIFQDSSCLRSIAWFDVCLSSCWFVYTWC